MNRLLFFLFLLFFCIKTDAEIQQDTIRTLGFYIVLDIPKDNIKKVLNYEEGIFYDFIIPQDTSVITIHCGAMVDLPLIRGKKVLSCQLINGILKDESGIYEKDGKLHYCREINIFPYDINITYDIVGSTFKRKYDLIFDNIKVEKIKSCVKDSQ
ncbi:MAG: hypothetical protein VZR36_11300 [Prevotella sp.]|nr:hypothetical protein [Prevotella sp.]